MSFVGRRRILLDPTDKTRRWSPSGLRLADCTVDAALAITARGCGCPSRPAAERDYCKSSLVHDLQVYQKLGHLPQKIAPTGRGRMVPQTIVTDLLASNLDADNSCRLGSVGRLSGRDRGLDVRIWTKITANETLADGRIGLRIASHGCTIGQDGHAFDKVEELTPRVV
jgi:hypothetical protein